MLCTPEDMHPYCCSGPGQCIHCDRRRRKRHDPVMCALCEETRQRRPAHGSPPWKRWQRQFKAEKKA